MTQTPATPAALVAAATPSPFRLLVTGSRTWTAEAAIRGALNDLHREYGNRLVVVHGACSTGADAIADQWCRNLGVPAERYPADWNTYGRAAGPRRNQQMVDTRPDRCLGFIRSASRGASHCATAAQAAGIPVRRYEK
jgi:hypothetical protein